MGYRIEPYSRIRYEVVTRIGINETSYRYEHKYLTAIAYHDINQAIWAGNGTGKAVLNVFLMTLQMNKRLI